jgi:hypothetical protein
VSPVVETLEGEVIRGLLGRGGRPLDVETRAVMERRFGHDFSRIRVHADSVAADSARAVDAHAYTIGANIVFGHGMYRPRDETGRRLLAHELAHAVQQGLAPRPPADLRVAPAQDAAEREASRAAGPAPASHRPGRCACGRPIVWPGGTCAECAGKLRDHRPAPLVQERAPIAIQRQSGGTQGQAQTASQGGGATPAVDARTSAEAFNLILQHEFSVVNTSWYLGTRSNLPPGGNVQADLAAGREGKVMFALSPDFAPAGQHAAGVAADPAHIEAVRREVIRVLDWRLAQGILTAADITAPFVKGRLRSMAPLELRALRARPKVDPAAGAEIDRILAITTQLPESAQFGSTGTAEFAVGNVLVRVFPDKRAGTENKTDFRTVPSQFDTPRATTVNGRVDQIIDPIPKPPVIEIFTTYAAQGTQAVHDPATARSAYGRGTTAADVAAKTTSLRFHESQHGADVLKFLAANRFPTFTGKVNDTSADFIQAGQTYSDAVKAWFDEMGRATFCPTDCVGSPNIDVFRHNVGASLKCRTCHP